MIIILKPKAGKKDADVILKKIESQGLKPLYMPGTERTVIGAIGDERKLGKLHFENYPCVERVTQVLSPYKMVSREAHPANSIVDVDGVKFGGEKVVVIAGPCAVESHKQLLETAKAVKKAGASILRGGAYKPRTSPYSFQGLGVEGLKILKDVSDELKMPTVTEVVEVADVEIVDKYASAFQIGARNMQNFRLLRAVGLSGKPVILKRGMAATLEDLLLAGEYIISEGNSKVIFCERGIRTFETATRNTLDLSAIPHIKQRSHLPIIADPSHGTGVRDYVKPMAAAAVACGADGLIVEVHCDPANAMSDGQQSLTPEQFKELMKSLKAFAKAAGRDI